MRIWLIKTGEEIPEDPGSPRLLRTGILAQHLARRGHEVTWWNATFNHQTKSQRSLPRVVSSQSGSRIVLLSGRSYSRNMSLDRIRNHMENARDFRASAPREPRPDAILCRCPTIELAAAACDFARASDIPIAVDFRDMWPDMILDEVPAPARILARLPIGHWDRLLARVVRDATAIVGITEAFVDWALSKAKRRRGPLDRAFHHAVDPEPINPSRLAEAASFWDERGIVRSDDVRVASFAGRLSRRYDLPALVEGALRLAPSERQRLRIVLCGTGDVEEELHREASGVEHVFLTGWRNAAELAVLLKRTHCGLLAYRSTRDYAISYPNKVGEYLKAGLPIATGLTGITGALIREKRLGFLYEEGNPESVERTLRAIACDPVDWTGYRQRAIATHVGMFDGNRIMSAFCDFIEDLATRSPRGTLTVSPEHRTA